MSAALKPPRRLWEVVSVSNLSRRDTTAFLIALAQVGAVRFRDDPETTTTSVSRAAVVRRRAKQAQSENLFEVLGVHWAASQDELEKSYMRQSQTFDISKFPLPLQEEFAHDAKVILDGMDRAWKTIHSRRERAEYRLNLIAPDVIETCAELLMKQAELSRWRGRLSEAAVLYRRVLELFPTDPSALEALRCMDGG